MPVLGACHLSLGINQSVQPYYTIKMSEGRDRWKAGEGDLLLTNFPQLRISRIYCQSTFLSQVYERTIHLITKRGLKRSIKYTPITQISFIVSYFNNVNPTRLCRHSFLHRKSAPGSEIHMLFLWIHYALHSLSLLLKLKRFQNASVTVSQ